jgi:hypothetical protein
MNGPQATNANRARGLPHSEYLDRLDRHLQSVGILASEAAFFVPPGSVGIEIDAGGAERYCAG